MKMYTAVSAPGKVLLAGGYLVLDRAYSGLVFGLSARIHVIVEDTRESSTHQDSEILVRSPQFQDASWRYKYHATKDAGGVEVVQTQESVDLLPSFPTALPVRNMARREYFTRTRSKPRSYMAPANNKAPDAQTSFTTVTLFISDFLCISRDLPTNIPMSQSVLH